MMMERRKWEVHEEGKLWKVKVNKEHKPEVKKEENKQGERNKEM
jgi:hypothetical protein